MAEIKGKSTLKAIEENESYSLVTNEPVKGGITWTVSLKSGLNKVVKNNHGRTIPIIFANRNNQYDLQLIVRAEYRLMDGQERMIEKEVVLQGTNNSRETQIGNEPKPDTGNKSAVVHTADTGKQEENKKTGITFKIHVYFDGTFGNKTNIRVMEKVIKRQLGEIKPDIHNDKYKKDGTVDHVQYEKDLKEYQKKVAASKDKIQDEVDTLSLGQKAKHVLDSKTKTGEIGKTIGYIVGADPTSSMSSYTQVYTNIPIIYDLEEIEIETNIEENISKEKTIKVYIEGVGTQNYKGDDFMALAVGSDSGGMGIPSKIKRAFDEITKKAKVIKVKQDTIQSVEICVLGFSRGAATSRNFVAERSRMLSTLKKINKGISESMLTYRFVGVFDTVCSVTDFTQQPKIRRDTIGGRVVDSYITSLQKNNVKDYKLAMKDTVKEVVHLVAADEHRLFFPLTSIRSSVEAGCGFELVLPGSHCDLGGGDPDLCKEAFSETLFKGDKNISLAEEYLIKNKWYPTVSPTELTKLMEVPIYIPNGFLQGETKVWQDVPVGKQYDLKRDVIVGYNRIPLAIMLHFTKKLGGIKLKGKEGADSTKVHEELEPVKESLLNYAINNHKHGRDITPVTLFNSRFNHLRTKYLHLSAVLDLSQDISEDISNITEIKDVARLNGDGFPNRAVFSDLGVLDELKGMGKKILENFSK